MVLYPNADRILATPAPLAHKYTSWSPYAYCAGNPVNFVDPDGRFVGALVDATSVALGVKNLIENIRLGNTRAAIGDGVGVAIDVVAAALPVIPGGVGLVRTGTKSVDTIEAANDISNGVFKNRVKLRKTVKEIIKDNSPKDFQGRFIDPNTGHPIEKGQEVFGHKTGQEWRKYKNNPINQSKSRKEVIEEQNNPQIYQIEDKKSNASHKYEER